MANIHIHIDDEDLNDLIVQDLQRYFEYLVDPKNDPHERKAEISILIGAISIVLRTYMLEKDFEEYMDKFKNE